jgi:hypothetical protein
LLIHWLLELMLKMLLILKWVGIENWSVIERWLLAVKNSLFLFNHEWIG